MHGDPVPPSFRAALRLDVLLNQYPVAAARLSALGYPVGTRPDAVSADWVHRYLTDWAARLNPVYLAASLPADFSYPDGGPAAYLLRHAVLPFLRERRIPLALMVGTRRQVNPSLRDAGDSVGATPIEPLQALLADHPDVPVLATYLSRESQYELTVTARKFGNLIPFGCWWFLNTDSLMDEIMRMRLELLGPTFIPQHSDARVLEHLIYKWARARRVTARVLAAHYERLVDLGWPVDQETVRRDVARLFRGYLLLALGLGALPLGLGFARRGLRGIFLAGRECLATLD
jgi:hypothetical protein